MSTARVYRIERDWAGSPVNATEDDYIGNIVGVIVGGPAPHPVADFQEVVSTEGMAGWPKDQDVTVRQGDRLSVDDTWYRVTGPAQWQREHALTGTDFGYVWHQIEADHGS